MKRDLRIILISLLFVSLFSIAGLGQETTGSLEVTVKDSAGAVVPNVSLKIESSGASIGFRRTITTDDSGFVRILQVPPGIYTITAAPTAGFVEKKVDQIGVSLGKTTSVPFEMSVTATATVDVSAGDVSAIDVTDTKIETTISAETAELLPKGLNFSSILKFSPATRPEPRSGQFQIDGASGSENTFVIDGQEVTNVRTGVLDNNSNLPFAAIQEVKVKSSGFEAEYGGATGGVITLSTKGGGNQFRGEFGIGLRHSKLEPTAGPTIRNVAGTLTLYESRRSEAKEKNPVASVGGPIWKDRVWFFVSYAPQISTANRELIFRNPDTFALTTRGSERYFSSARKEAVFGRIDAQPFERLRVTGTYNWNPISHVGVVTAGGLAGVPGFANELNPAYISAATFNSAGGRQNSQNYTISGAYSITNALLVTARTGHYFLNEKLNTYNQGNVKVPTVFCANVPLSSQQFPANFGCVRNTSNGAPFVDDTPKDVTTRDQIDADATYSFSIGGRHELKGGYQRSKIANDVISGRNDQITLRWGTGPLSTVGSISGNFGLIPSAPGATGSGSLSLFETRGDVSSSNLGFFIQDKWQPFSRLTLNLGVRAEKEDVPSYTEGLPGMNFSFSSKIAPRLGAAYDLTGDGKTKVSAFWGLFYDRFKLELPRGSFGGDLFHTVYFDLFATDTLANINRNTIFGGTDVPRAGGGCPFGTTTPIYGRVRCDYDFRVSSNSGGPLTEVGGIDPDIKPFQQSEMTFTFQRQLTQRYLFSARYTRKEVLHAIEDAGFPNPAGSEYYIIGNPGEGLHKQQADTFGVLAPKAIREYDALELRFDRAFSNNYFFSVNYTLSRLYGNYGGLSSSDEEGRLSPNVNRYFDQPHAGFTVAGGLDTGRLATDRPHVLKAYGAYSLNWSQFGLWKANTTDFEVFTTASSGTLITSFVNINNISQIVLTKRGDQGRTPVFTQTDFALRHSIKFGRDDRFTIKGDFDAINVFNQRIVTNLGLNPSGQGGNIINTGAFNVLLPANGLITQEQLTACGNNQQPCFIIAYKNFQQNGSPAILAAANAPAGRNVFYNHPVQRQGKRTIRYGLRFIF